MSTQPEIAVVGGGPAGLAAAEVLAGRGQRVVVYDRMPSPGRKFLLAGRGGLNLTHTEPPERFRARYHPGDDRLAGALAAFGPEDLRAWCADLGEPTFVGSSGRVFPRSFKASPLLRAWLARLAGLGVEIRPRHRLTAWRADGLAFATPAGTLEVAPAATLLALGGASWPRFGSDGAWSALMAALDVPVAPLRPANVGFTAPWSPHFAARFAGTALKRTGFALGADRLVGEAMITRDGLEGGAIYALTRPLRERVAAAGSAPLELDLRPDLDEPDLAARLARRRPGESGATHLRKAAGLPPVAIGLLREAHGLALPSAPAELAARIKRAPIVLGHPRPLAQAISTAGGIRFAALDARFMLVARPGTFVAGEMLDWEAPTGGYLLQAAFATGRAAADGLMTWLDARGSSGDARN